MPNCERDSRGDSLSKSLVCIAEQITVCDGWEELQSQVDAADKLLWTAFQNGDLAHAPVHTNRIEHYIALHLDGHEQPRGSGLAEYLIGQTVRLPNFSIEMPWCEYRDCANWLGIGLREVARQLRTVPKSSNNTIPPENRTIPMSYRRAAKLMGKGDSQDAGEWLSKSVSDGSIPCEHVTRQTHVFSLESFPAAVWPQITPK